MAKIRGKPQQVTAWQDLPYAIFFVVQLIVIITCGVRFGLTLFEDADSRKVFHNVFSSSSSSAAIATGGSDVYTTSASPTAAYSSNHHSTTAIPLLGESLTAELTSNKELVAKMKTAAIDVAYVGGYHTEAALIVREMRAQEMTTQLISGEALVTREFWQVTGEAGEGTLMTFSPDPRRNPAAKDVVAKFRAKQIEPEGYVLYTYAAIQAWAQAAAAAGTETSDKVIAKLNGMAFSTVLGKFKFDEKGDPDLPAYTFYQWKAGSYDQIN